MFFLNYQRDIEYPIVKCHKTIRTFALKEAVNGVTYHNCSVARDGHLLNHWKKIDDKICVG